MAKKKTPKEQAPSQSAKKQVGKTSTVYSATSGTTAASPLRVTAATVTIDVATIDDDGSGQLAASVAATVTVDAIIADPVGSPRVRITDSNDNLIAEQDLLNTGGGGNTWGLNNIAPGAFVSGTTYKFKVIQDYTLKPFGGSVSDSDSVTA